MLPILGIKDNFSSTRQTKQMENILISALYFDCVEETILFSKKVRNIHAVPTRKSRKNIRSKNILVFIVKNACTY